MEEKKKPIIERKSVQNYMKYSGMGFQMLGILLITWYIGSYLDERYENETAYWTAGLMLVGIVVFFVSLFMQLARDEKNS